MKDKYITRTGADYATVLQRLLPRGRAWLRQATKVMWPVLRGLTEHLGRFDMRAAILLRRESDPRYTIELLPDWERVAGLPDKCFPAALSISERQQALVAKLTMRGGQSRAYFLSLAERLGYQGVTITEFSPFMCGISPCGDNGGRWEIGHPDMRFWWEVTVPDPRLTWFRCGEGGGQCGIDPMVRIKRAEDLECVFRRYKPAHTDIIFNYAGV